MAGSPQRMLFGAVAIWIGFRGNVLLRRALAFLKRIRIAHDLLFLVALALAFAGVFESAALLRSASFRSTGTPCFLSRSSNASSASSCKVAILSRASCARAQAQEAIGNDSKRTRPLAQYTANDLASPGH